VYAPSMNLARRQKNTMRAPNMALPIVMGHWPKAQRQAAAVFALDTAQGDHRCDSYSELA